MKKPTLSRRLLAGAAGLAVGLGGAIAAAVPAQAVVEQNPHHPVVVEHPTCEDPEGEITIPRAGFGRSYTINGNVKDEGTYEKGPGSYEIKRVGNLSGHVYFSTTVVFEEATDCEDPDEKREHDGRTLIKEPTVTDPTCEEKATIAIPSVHKVQLFDYKINGEPVERGSTHHVKPGEYQVDVVGKFTGKVWKTFHYHFEKPDDCPDDDPGKEEENGKEDEEEPGEGGELPKTGAQSALIAGGALLLLTLGGAMYVMARRRRITFTA